jgi:MFS family permease
LPLLSLTISPSNSGQYYGIAAAFGKVGAFVGSYVFPIIENNAPNATRSGQDPFFVGSALAIFSGLLAIFCLPKIDQDTIEYEDTRFRAYLAENGYDTTKMGLHTDSDVHLEGGPAQVGGLEKS